MNETLAADMTLRDHIAISAMAAMLATDRIGDDYQWCGFKNHAELAAWSYEIAAAMMAERAKRLQEVPHA